MLHSVSLENYRFATEIVGRPSRERRVRGTQPCSDRYLAGWKIVGRFVNMEACDPLDFR